ncbi:MAG: glycyl radical protein [Candidatus Cloacimonetes bacterium]|nr:glycyl radical protein [Candidatus Cloacimonadota bacterium]MCF7814610.1 glycyl radical protein [Candidatus Cloacimonadota bacterium]MCF7868108.1 glycyl radical protein [Candidatus Cloacimonadota bacterium]MCF7883574.1 glycyl radical protein [Candidatus Cloacimonadota bacterium]
MTERIKKLRQDSLDAVNKITAERALLVTEFYKTILAENLPIPIQRARCLQYIFKHKQICLNEGELIVGERGPAPKATPTYPEICLHSIQDLQILDSRPKVSFQVDEEVFQAYEKIVIPFWKGKTQRDKIFEAMDKNWLESYGAGVFTEFQEQRAPGHTVLGDKIYRLGMLDIIQQINDVKTQTIDPAKLAELEAMEIAARAIIMYANRHAKKVEKLAENETDKNRKQELLKIAEICRKVPANKPETFQEALQYYWFVHLGVITELNPWDSFNPGRLDQHLYPFYKKEIEAGTLTKQKAIELLQTFWIKFNNHPSPPKMGVTAQESNTYTDFALINVGGLKVDGSNAVNDLSYIILDVIEEMRILQPSSMVQISSKTPDKFIERALKIVKTGFGQPSIFNSDCIVKELTRQEKSIIDARNGGASGCVEAGAFGTESYILTGYFNLTKILEITLNNGVDPRTGKKIGIEIGDPREFQTFDELLSAFQKQENYFAEIKLKGNDKIEKLYAENLPAPFLSLLIDDCISNATDYNARGARYNTSYVQGVGLGSITDILTSIKYNVFDNKKISMSELLNALNANYSGYENLRFDLIYNTPKYGNDDDYADENAVKVFEIFFDSIDGKPTALNATYRINMLPTTSHVYFGSVIGATADGRKSGVPLSEGISPVQGADKNGPTAVMKSAAKFDHTKTGGTLLNQKFTPAFFENNESISKLGKLIRGYFAMDTHHIQFNVVTAETLKKAQKHPEQYRDLIVRVAGYSDYFNDLGKDLQNEIIRRTEQGVNS